MSSAPAALAFDRLVGRLVRRDAADAYGMLVVGAAFLALFLARAWPPHEVRAALVAADALPRALALAGVGGLYLLVTAPIGRRLLASGRLAYLRHWPIAPTRWRALHLRHLLSIHLPWWAATAYGLASPDLSLGIVERGALGVAWASWTVAGQVAMVHAGSAAARLLGVVAAIVAIALVCMSASVALAGATVIPSALVVGRLLLRPPPEPSATAIRWPWSPRRPTSALARLDALALVRRAPEVVRRRVLASIGLASIGALAAAAAARVGEPVDPWILRTSAILAAFFGAHLTIVAQRLVDRDGWYVDSLSPSNGAVVGARLVLGVVAALPGLALWTASRIAFDGAASPARIVVDALVAGGLAATTMSIAGARAEAKRRLHGRIFEGPALTAVAAIGLWSVTGESLVLTPAIVAAAALAPRTVAAAAATRRRLETGRRDDDHE